MTIENNNRKDCIRYLKSKKILDQMIHKFLDKYRSYEGAVGSIILTNPSIEDVEVLEGFFGVGLRGKKNITISAKRFDGALKNSRFCEVTLEEILKNYGAGTLLSKKQEKEIADLEKEYFFREMREKFPTDSIAVKWLEESDIITRSLLKKYHSDAKELEFLLKQVMKALNALPVLRAAYEYLPIFSAQITGNPHFFDVNTSAYGLLRDGIKYYVEKIVGDVEIIDSGNNIEQKKLLFKAGLLPDGISNYTIAYGIRGYLEDGSEHLGIKGFYQQEEAVQLSLLPIMWLKTVTCEGNAIYVVENPSIFVSIVDKFKHKYAVMCINGQPNMASLILLEKIRISGNSIYYAGDFDPEGLLIAQNLKTFCENKVNFWKMNCTYYKKALSEKKITDKRLKMLDKLTDPKLAEIAKEMKILKRAGYQEKIIDEYLEET